MKFTQEKYSLVISGEPDKNELQVDLRKWENDKEVLSESYKMKQVDGFSNRVIIDSKIPIVCEKTSDGEIFCDVQNISVGLPKVCVKKEINGKIETICGIDKIGWNDKVLAINILAEANKLKEDIIDFMARHDVTLVLDYTIKGDLLGTAKCYGKSGICSINLNARIPRTLKEKVGTFMHEFAHVREWIAREEKGLVPFSERTGKWEKAVKEFYEDGKKIIITKYIPIGHEMRAEKFKRRMLRFMD